MFPVIIADVVLRSAGMQPPLWTGAYTEFGLLYAAMLAAPWLIERDGYIRVRALTDHLAPAAARRLERAVFITLSLPCALLALTAFNVALDAFQRGEVEYRSIMLPRWLLFAPMPLGFARCAAEFLRAAVGGLRDRAGRADVERSL